MSNRLTRWLASDAEVKCPDCLHFPPPNYYRPYLDPYCTSCNNSKTKLTSVGIFWLWILLILLCIVSFFMIKLMIVSNGMKPDIFRAGIIAAIAMTIIFGNLLTKKPAVTNEEDYTEYVSIRISLYTAIIIIPPLFGYEMLNNVLLPGALRMPPEQFFGFIYGLSFTCMIAFISCLRITLSYKN